MWQLSHVALHHRRSKRLAPRRAQRRPHGEAGVLPDGRVRARADRPPAHALGRALPPAQQRAARVRVAGLRGAAPRRAARGVCRGGRSVAAAVHALRVWGSSSRLHHRLCCRGEAARSARRCAAAKLRPSSLCLCDSLKKAIGLETLPHGGIMNILMPCLYRAQARSGPRARRAQVRLWDAPSGVCLATHSFQKPIASLAFHCDRAHRLLAVASGHKARGRAPARARSPRRPRRGRPEPRRARPAAGGRGRAPPRPARAAPGCAPGARARRGVCGAGGRWGARGCGPGRRP